MYASDISSGGSGLLVSRLSVGFRVDIFSFERFIFCLEERQRALSKIIMTR